jgi:hypothetical protein
MATNSVAVPHHFYAVPTQLLIKKKKKVNLRPKGYANGNGKSMKLLTVCKFVKSI